MMGATAKISWSRRGVVCVGIPLGCFAILGILLGCDARDREDERRRVGDELGLAYQAALDPSLAAEVSSLPSLDGEGKRGQNLFVQALTSADLLVFDWVWREGPLKERNRESQTVVAVRLPGGRSVSPFVWVERGALSRQDLRRFGEPIEWTDEMRFSDAYQVVGVDRRGLRDFFTPEARSRLDLPGGMRIEGGGDWLIGWRPGERLDAADLRGAVAAMRSIAAGE